MLGVGDCLDIGTTGVAFSEGERNLVARPVPKFPREKRLSAAQESDSQGG
jgi:hypothetical protein